MTQPTDALRERLQTLLLEPTMIDAICDRVRSLISEAVGGAFEQKAKLLHKLAASWIDTGQQGTGLRTDAYVTEHREAIMGIYEYTGKTLLEYLNYQPQAQAALAERDKRVRKPADFTGSTGAAKDGEAK